MYFKGVILILIACIVSAIVATAQVVNVEKERHKTDTTGFSGGIKLNGSYLDNDNVIYNLEIVPDVQFKTKKDLILLIGNYEITKSNEVNFQDAAFLHLRYNRKLNKWLRWEAFTQVQYNEIKRLNYRFLIGTGPRFKLLENDFSKVYIGLLPMYESEEVRNDEVVAINEAWRLSNYISVSLFLNDVASIFSTSYYQPKFDDFKDARFYSETRLSLKISKNFRFTSGLVYTWDPFPPTTAPRRTLELTTGLGFKF